MGDITDLNKQSNKNKRVNIGDRFGEWTVIEDVNKEYKVKCRCSCGKEKYVNIYTLISGRSTGCGHTKNQDRILDLTGRQFGELTALKYRGNQYWECLCSCGNTTLKRRSHLLDGRARNCGHNKLPENLIGKKFGKLTPIKYAGNKRWICKCDCGNTKIVRSMNLLNGSTVSCGCINNHYTKEELIDMAEQFKSKYGEYPKMYELAEFIGCSQGSMRYHLDKNELTHSKYIDCSYTSKGEREVYYYVQSICSSKIEHSVKNVIPPYELDIYIPDLNLAIEFNGTYWHSEHNKKPTYHIDKTIECAKKKIRLIHIFEYEWEDKSTQIKLKELLRDIIDKHYGKVLYAKELKIKQFGNDVAEDFYNKYHLQNSIDSNYNIGLYLGNELIQAMSFSRSRFDRNYQIELTRLCTKFGYKVVGGAQKLFKYFIQNYNPSSIVSYCDMSKFLGSTYINLGMRHDSLTPPSYVWVSNTDIMSRYEAQKKELVKNGFGTEDETESTIMSRMGYIRIYGCGNRKFVWENRDM